MMTPPRKPGALTLSTLSRLAGRVVCGLALVWMLALVGWPVKRGQCQMCWWLRHSVSIAYMPHEHWYTIDDSPAVILGKLGR